MAHAGSDAAEPASWRRIPRVGDVVGGKYRVERVLGRGGMGIVVAAHHLSLRHRVALKFLLPEGRTTPGATERFFREAQAAAAIASEHIARVIDVGQTDDDLPYFVMEYLNGIDLEALLESRGPLPVEQAVSYVIEACEALAEAHSLGIVHRDLKPGNLFLASRKDGSTLIKVLDFGISKASEEGVLGLNAQLTASAVVLGSPRYMSPEHIRSTRTVDARSDIWALGMTLYQLLTGRLPFETESVSALFVSIVTDAPVPPRSHRPEIPLALEWVILMCLEKDPARRPQTIAELATLLEPLGSESARQTVARILRRAMGNEAVDAPPAPDRPRAIDEEAETLTGPIGPTRGSRHSVSEQAKERASSMPPTRASVAPPSLATAASPSMPPARVSVAPLTLTATASPSVPPARVSVVPLTPTAAASPSVPPAQAPAAGPPSVHTLPPDESLAPTAAPSRRGERAAAGDPQGRRRRSLVAPLAAAALVALLGGMAATAWLGRGAAPAAGAPPAGEAASQAAPAQGEPSAPSSEEPGPSSLPPPDVASPPTAAAAAAASGFATAGAALAPLGSAKAGRPRAVLAPSSPYPASSEPAPTKATRLREHR
ncbi:protein kinase domain-containing protein [Sorangium sp. So ce145]|uniref:serine/threonine-protein kinase n=1 Tax=Sorangium sp. So ce145 TaxID=3133285 RepID=UPI003F62A54B